MNLRDRLRLLKAAGTAKPAAAPASQEDPALAVGPSHVSKTTPHTPSFGAPPSGSSNSQGARPASLGSGIYGYELETAYGPTFYVEERYPVEYHRGSVALEQLFAVADGAWEVLARVQPGLDMRQAVFFDTETTGLAGGSGTYAFLIGLGFFDRHDFVVRQYFLRDYAEEEALLDALERDLAPTSVLVSFNGKSFDWPLVETRYRMTRRRPPLSGIAHLDLLHPARRLWKERLGACNLTNLEAQILGVQRHGDVAGHLIPDLYFHYLRTGEAGELAGVLLHNRLDIVSLVSLAAYMGQLVTDPLSPTPDGELAPGDDLFAVARLLEDRGHLGPALTCYEASLERGVPSVGENRAMAALSGAYKRIREHERAISIWQAMIRGAGALSLYPYVELAKYYEHVAKDYPLALELASRALSVAERRRKIAGQYGPSTLKDLQAVQHRLERLQRKVRGNK